MPFKISGNYVVNSETGQRKNKTPLPRARLQKYLKALYANVPEARKTTHKSFVGHRGIPGHRGGSLPRTASGVLKTSNKLGMRTASLKMATKGIENVHSVEGIAPVTYYESGKFLKGVNGGFNPSKRYIVVNSQGNYKALTATHEFGHVLEKEAFKTPAAKAKLKAVYSAIDNTAGVKMLKRGKVSKTIDFNGKKYVVGGNIFGYYLKQDELFARSYAQYIASKPGNKPLYTQLVRRRKSPLNGQWSDGDFKQVSKAYDELFKEVGWAK